MTYLSETVPLCAREWLHTPFHHAARKCQVGTDCIGFIIGVGNQIRARSVLDGRALSCHDHGHYDSLRQGSLLKDMMYHHFLPCEEMHPGCILLFRLPPYGYHTAIHVGNSCMMHAHMGVGCVVEEKISSRWLGRFDHSFQYNI